MTELLSSPSSPSSAPGKALRGRTRPPGASWAAFVAAAWFVLAGCSPSEELGPAGTAAAGGGASATGGAGGSVGVGGATGGVPTGASEVANKAIHRLSNLEYDNTLRDLTGTELRFEHTFVSEEVEGFDNIATSL